MKNNIWENDLKKLNFFERRKLKKRLKKNIKNKLPKLFFQELTRVAVLLEKINGNLNKINKYDSSKAEDLKNSAIFNDIEIVEKIHKQED